MTGDHAVAVRAVALLPEAGRPVPGQLVQLGERPLVQQLRDALARRLLALGVLLLHGPGRPRVDRLVVAAVQVGQPAGGGVQVRGGGRGVGVGGGSSIGHGGQPSLVDVREPLDVRALREALLTPGSPWRSIDGHESVDSTNLEAARRPEPWRVVVADHQSAGRGRMARHWEAPAGASVAVSVVVPMAGADRGWLPLLTGMAMAGALQRVAGVPARLKWPNDVLVDDGKICGVLCEMVHPRPPAGSPAGPVVPAAWSSPARAPTWTSAGRSCRWTRRRPCGCAGSPACDGRTCSSPTSTASPSCTRPGSAGVRRCRSSAGSTAPCASPSGRTSGCTSPRVPSRRGRAVAVDDSGRLVLDGPAGRRAHAAGDVVHVRPQD